MRSLRKIRIFDVEFDALTLFELIEELEKLIASKTGSFIVTANPEIVMAAGKDPEFLGIMKKANFVTADGIGVIIASKLLGRPLPERVTGIEIVTKLFELGEQKGYKFYFLGAREGIAAEAAENLRKKYPELNIVGVQHGFYSDEQAVISDIENKRPDILLVALGMGRQERWIYKHKDQLQIPLSIGVGGSFDVLSGRLQRAPVWMQKVGLEWLYRLYQEPQRLGRMSILPIFLFKILLLKFRGNK